MIDIKALTLGEMAVVEELGGQPLSVLADPDKPKTKTITALAYVFKRRTNPEFSWIDAENMTMDDLNELLGLDEEEEADEDSPEGKGASSATSKPSN